MNAHAEFFLPIELPTDVRNCERLGVTPRANCRRDWWPAATSHESLVNIERAAENERVGEFFSLEICEEKRETLLLLFYYCYYYIDGEDGNERILGDIFQQVVVRLRRQVL